MNEFFSYALLGLIQGVTEFLPVSSSGHLILLRDLLGETANGLAADAVLQLATVLAVIVYFIKDLLRVADTAFKKFLGRSVPKEDEHLLLALIVGTVPAVILGLLLEHTMETIFRNSYLVAYALVVGSLLMLVAEYVATRLNTHTSIAAMSWKKGFLIGLFQSFALIPGMSRSGMTISGGLFLGLSREAAARFGFLLAVPIIAGSGLKKLYDLWKGDELVTLGTPLLVGSAIAFVSGLLAIQFLLRFLRKQPLYVFIVYRLFLAALILFVF